jgi:hypothetical protein
MNGAAYATAWREARVGGVYDGANVEGGDFGALGDELSGEYSQK